jgi:hypothetical protein
MGMKKSNYKEILNMKYLCKGIKHLFMVLYLMKLDAILYPITKKWKEVELWKYKHKITEVTRDKCIPLGIKDDNIPTKFVVPIENATLKYHNLYKSGLENIEL